MFARLSAGLLLALLIAGCSSGPPAGTAAPGATRTPGGAAPTLAPGNPTAQPNAGDLEAKARALVPPGSTETGELQAGTLYQLHVRSPMTMDQLEAFWAQALPAQGMTVTGSFKTAGVLTIAFENPSGGILAAPDAVNGGIAITFSLGISN